MSLLNDYQILLANLEGRILRGSLTFLSNEDARAALIRETGQDFGYDATEWRNWLRANKTVLPQTHRWRDEDFD